MANQHVSTLQMLNQGPSDVTLKVIVDRIINRYQEMGCTRHKRPALELESVDLIIYDNTIDTRMMVRILSMDLMNKHCWKLVEGSCYDISGFIVRDGGESIHESIHIVITDKSKIAPTFSDGLPKRFFLLHSVQDTKWWGQPNNHRAIDVCGILKSFSRISNYICGGLYKMSLTMELEDKRKQCVVRCILQRQALESALPQLDRLAGHVGVFVVVQYAEIMGKIEGGVEISAVDGTTRVFIDPDFLELASAKMTELGE